ncbi:hypothetical protein QQP08_003174 [Theobroma cacao]|nr:hypothetical protein QQP08_003174 [Theobroma cacao]
MGKEIESSGSNSVGSSKFVRTNPMSDRFKVKRFHHRCHKCCSPVLMGPWHAIGCQVRPSTGNMAQASYLIRSGECNFLFTAPYSLSIAQAENLSPTATASIPTFDHAICRAFVASHGLAPRAIFVEVEDAETAFFISVSHGAKPSSPPTVLDNQAVLAEVFLFGDVVLRYISFKNSDHESPNDDENCTWFLPRFEKMEDTLSYPLDYGIRRLDHLVGSVPELGPAVSYLKEVTGFHEFAEFTTEDVGTLESGLNSLVLASNNEMVLLVICEPVFGTKRRSQIQTFLEHNDGEGVQHLALVSGDIFKTLREGWRPRVYAASTTNILQEFKEESRRCAK